MKQIKTLLSLIFCMVAVAVFAQNSDTFDEFRKQKQKEFDDYRDKTQKEFEDYRAEVNAEFAKFMREKWTVYKREKPVPAPVIPDKPIPPVVAPEPRPDIKPVTKPVVIEEVVNVPVVVPEPPKPVAPIEEIKEPEPEPSLGFTFFGADCKVRLHEKQRFRLANTRENAVADAWETLSGKDYNNLIRDCLSLRDSLNLCDWAYLLLTGTVGKTFFPDAPDEAVLLQAFLMNQSGYRIRLARSPKGKLFMLYASDYSIFGHAYYTIENVKFYLDRNADKDDNRLHIFARAFRGEQTLSVLIAGEQRFPAGKSNERKLSAKRYPEATVTVTTNQNLIDFYKVYPQSGVNRDFTTKWKFYANTPLSAQVREPLYAKLKAAIAGKSESAAANLLLNFVQTAFTYGYDDEIWGGDRPFFPEETVHYPYSDCEDRAMLFSRLVRDLLGLPTVLLYYPNHLATAVKFNEAVSGDCIDLSDGRYFVCDPTYVNAVIGMTMSGMDNSTVKALILNQ